MALKGYMAPPCSEDCVRNELIKVWSFFSVKKEYPPNSAMVDAMSILARVRLECGTEISHQHSLSSPPFWVKPWSEVENDRFYTTRNSDDDVPQQNHIRSLICFKCSNELQTQKLDIGNPKIEALKVFNVAVFNLN